MADWWDDARYGAAMTRTGHEAALDHALAETRIHDECRSDIVRLVPTEEQARWGDGYSPSAEPATTQLIRRLITSQQSSISVLPLTLTLWTQQVNCITHQHTNTPTHPHTHTPTHPHTHTHPHPPATLTGATDRLHRTHRARLGHRGRTDGHDRRSRRGATPYRAHITHISHIYHMHPDARSRLQVRPAWASIADVIGDGADALKPKAMLNVTDLRGKLHPRRDCITKKASWICDQVRHV